MGNHYHAVLQRIEGLRDSVAIGGEAFRRKLEAPADVGDRETSGKREWRRRAGFVERVSAVL